MAVDVDSVLFVDQQQLAQYTYFFSNKSHSCAAQCECSVCTAMHHTESNEDSSAIVHQCDPDSESECVGFC